MFGMYLHKLAIAGLNCEFGMWQRKIQPGIAEIDPREFQHENALRLSLRQYIDVARNEQSQ